MNSVPAPAESVDSPSALDSAWPPDSDTRFWESRVRFDDLSEAAEAFEPDPEDAAWLAAQELRREALEYAAAVMEGRAIQFPDDPFRRAVFCEAMNYAELTSVRSRGLEFESQEVRGGWGAHGDGDN